MAYYAIRLFHLTLCLALILSAPAIAASAASGHFIVKRKAYAVADAIAWQGQNGIEVLFGEKKLDAPQLLSDYALDVNDQFNLDGASMRITIYKIDGSSYALNFRSPDGSDGDPLCDKGDHLKISRLDKTSVAGRFICEDYDVTFDLPLITQPPGSQLGKGGGEPGKVLFARAAALAANDFDAFLETCSPREAKKALQSQAAGKEELASRFRFLSHVTPADVKILAGTQVDDRAWLNFANLDQSVMGTTFLVRQDGRWLIDGTTMRQ